MGVESFTLTLMVETNYLTISKYAIMLHGHFVQYNTTLLSNFLTINNQLCFVLKAFASTTTICYYVTWAL